MSTSTSAPMTLRDAVNLGFNRMAAALLGIAGLAFGSLIFEEPDLIDKLDNSILVVVAVLAIAWYFSARHRFERSAVPLALAGLGVVGQFLGIGIEFGDAAAFGDDIGGLVVYGSSLLVLWITYSANRALTD